MKRNFIHNLICLLSWLSLWLSSQYIYAQQDSTELWVNVDSIYISATRIDNNLQKTSRAISNRDLSDLQAKLPQFTLQELVSDVSSVFTQNTQNMAQDLRVSIRGFGSRASFGVRGIKLIVDGIPETTADGQGQLDALPLGLIQNIEVIKGPSATLYGQASGGVIQMNTLSEFNFNLSEKPLLESRLLLGSYNTSQVQLTYGRKVGNTSYVFHGNQLSSDGYRNHSGFLNRNFKSRLDHKFNKFSKINVMLDFLSSPRGDDPGGLTTEEAVVDPQLARQRNLDFNTGEAIDNFKASVNYQLIASKNRTMDVYGFYTSRDFLGFLPFETGGIVDLGRSYFGQGIGYTIKTYKKHYKATIKYGYDLANQIDNRVRYSNLNGEQGATDLAQKEIFNNAGLYMLMQVDVDKLLVTAGLRYDYNYIELKDELEFGADDSGSLGFSNFNPSVSVSYELDDATNVFAGFSTGFDTPNLLELTNNPDNQSGLNPNLVPQLSNNFEIGGRVSVADKYQLSLTLFHINTEKELVPFSLATQPDQTFYRNAGETSRQGLELEGNYQVNDQLDFAVSLTVASYKYGNYVVDSVGFTGNALPGLPGQLAHLRVNYELPSGISLTSTNTFVGSMFTADDNLTKVDSYILSNLYGSYPISLGSYTLQPFLGLQNIFDASYFDNIRINAFGARYYEPAPGFNFFTGVRLRL